MFQRVAHALFNGPTVLRRAHVDKVDDDQAAHVPQAQLACDFFGRFKVSVQSRRFDVAAFGRTCGVDVDTDQSFGRIDHQ